MTGPRLRRQAPADERGSLLVALSVVMVLTGLSLAVLARTLGALQSARAGQDRAAALAAADAGVSDALFALDQLPVDSPPPPAIPTSGSRHGTAASGAAFAWRASQGPDDNTYAITSSGTVNGVTRTVTETASRRPRYPFAVFAADGLSLNNGSVGPYSTAPAQGIWAETGGARDATRKAVIGSNHDIVLSPSSAPNAGDSQLTFSPAGGCSGCPKPATDTSGPFSTPDPVVPASATSFSCNVDGTATEVTLSGGPYMCTAGLTMKGVVKVLGPVTIYLENGTGGQGAPTTLELSGLQMDPASDPADLEILKAGPGPVDVGTAGVTFRGVIYAPDAALTPSTCKVTVVGALTLDSLACDSSTASLAVEYDQGVEGLLGDGWRTSDFHEIAPTPL